MTAGAYVGAVSERPRSGEPAPVIGWVKITPLDDRRRTGQQYSEFLAPADAATLSCWQEPFAHAFRTRPPRPL